MCCRAVCRLSLPQKTTGRAHSKHCTARRASFSSGFKCGQRAAARWHRRQASIVASSAATMTVEQARALLDRYSPLPKLVVLDLDYIIWPFWCESFRVSDTPWLFPHVPAILAALEERSIPVAVASRTPTPHVASAFLRKLNLHDRFCSLQLIPAQDGFDHHTAQKNTEHLPNIRQETGLQYEHMLFFDDESKNVKRVAKLGVASVLVSTQRGLDLQALEQGLKLFQEQQQ